jgi:DNA-binding transcriptional LysR family regulator
LSRTTRSVGLTEAGERLLVHARPAMEMLSLGLDAAASLGDDVSGRLRINLPRAALPLFANRLLPDFLEAYPKPAEPEPNRGLRHTCPSAVRAILDDPPIRIRPIFPHRAGAKETNPVGSSHFGILMMASTMPRSHQILLTTCRECVCKRLRTREV